MSEIVEELVAEIAPDDVALYRPRYNAAPSDLHWIVELGADRRVVRPAVWGYMAGPRPLINVRGERVASGEGFRQSFANERCAIITDGFFEWTKDREPFWFRRRDGRLLLLAGLAQRPRPSEPGAHPRFTILTTRPNREVAPVHDRMPVVLEVGRLDDWLAEPATAAASLIVSAPDQTLDVTHVSRRVNSVKHDDPACVAPATSADRPPTERQLKLF